MDVVMIKEDLQEDGKEVKTGVGAEKKRSSRRMG